MKTKLLLIYCLLITSLLWSQTEDRKGAKVVTTSQAIQNNNFTVQVGVPYLGQNLNAMERNTKPLDIRFPWDILYLYNTFSEESFDVSKGYFGDKILLSWEIRNNLNSTNIIKIYRKEFGQAAPYSFIANVSKNDTQYEDKYAKLAQK